MKATAPEVTLNLNNTQELKLYIALNALKMGVTPRLLLDTVKGESTYKIGVLGDSGAACGLAQYHKESFERHKKEAIKQGYPFEDFTYCDPRSEIQLMAWAFSQGEKFRNEWSAYKKIVSD